MIITNSLPIMFRQNGPNIGSFVQTVMNVLSAITGNVYGGIGSSYGTPIQLGNQKG